MSTPVDVPPDVPADSPLAAEPERRHPMGSPYAVPLSTLVAAAMVASHDHVQLVPGDSTPLLPADLGVPVGPEGGGDGGD